MPNWCVGSIRFRGKFASIKELLENELTCVYSDKNFDLHEAKPVVAVDEYCEILIRQPDGFVGGYPAFHINGTRRNFIDGATAYPTVFKEYGKDDAIVYFNNFSAAWGVDVEPYKKLSKEYGVDIRIIGSERGMMFEVDIIIEKGSVTRSVEHSVKHSTEWYWEAARPDIGG